jgi:intein-encoded DNA endonuclease-like protein
VPPTKRAEAETVVPGLADCLAAWRHDGDTFTEIAWRLRTDHGITVSAETVRQWCSTNDGPAAA